MIYTKYTHMNDDELLRHVMCRDVDDLTRELSYRLHAALDAADEAEECTEDLLSQLEEAGIEVTMHEGDR